MKLLSICAIAMICGAAWMFSTATRPVAASDEEQALLDADRAVFAAGNSPVRLNGDALDPDFTWTDFAGSTRNRSEILRAVGDGKGLPREGQSGPGMGKAHVDGRIGIIQESGGKLYILRVWVKRGAGWQLLVYQAVKSGAPASNESGTTECNNPCKTVPFEPKNDDQRDVIHAYQSVERAVTAHDSAA